MQQLQHTTHDPNQNGLCLFHGCTASLNSRLGQFNIPVTINIPDEIIQLGAGNPDFKLVQVVVDFLCKVVETVYNPAVFHGELFRQSVELEVLRQIHHDKPRSVPELVCKVTGSLYLVVTVPHIITRSVARCQHKPQSICTVFINDFQRVNAVAQGLGHLSALFIPYQTMNQNRIKRHFVHALQAGEHHPNNPEENNIIARYQCVGWVEILQFFGLIRPAQC